MPKEYSKGFKYLHWMIAVLVLCMLTVGFLMPGLDAAQKPTVYMLHKSTGITVLALMLLRAVWLAVMGKPKLPQTVPLWERCLASITQYALYCFLIAMALSGWLMATASNKAPVYFGLFRAPFPGVSSNKTLAGIMYQTHGVIAWVLLGLVGLHIAGALKHWLIEKDDVIRRMLP